MDTTFVAGKLKICSITFKYYGIVRTELFLKQRRVDALGIVCVTLAYLCFSM